MRNILENNMHYIIAFLFGIALAAFGLPFTAPGYWVLCILIIAYRAAP